MIGSRAWFALMRRNLIYRKRYMFMTIFEIVLPACFIGLLLWIKKLDAGSDEFETVIIPPDFPGAEFATHTALSFYDYLTALRAPRTCADLRLADYGIDEGDIGFVGDVNIPKHSISGFLPGSYNWQVPMLKCDARMCKNAGDDAWKTGCEVNVIGIAGDETRKAEFVEWLNVKYPILVDNANFLFDPSIELVRDFITGDDMDSYVSSRLYGKYPENPKLAIGIVFNGNDPNVFDYTLRQNSTNFNSLEQEGRPATFTTPSTSKKTKDFAKIDDVCTPIEGTPNLGVYQDSCTGQYMYNGVLTFQRLLNDFIMDKTSASSSDLYVSEGGVQFVPFPTKSYKEAGFYGSLGDYGPLIIGIGLLFPVAVMISYITQEKELRQKELMKMMSVAESDIGWSWFITFMGFHLITVVIAAWLSDILYNESVFVMFLVFWFFTMMSIITFCMGIAAMTSKATRSVLIGIMIFIAGIFLPLAVSMEDGDIGSILLISIHPVSAFTYGLAQIGKLEEDGIGLTWDTVDLASGNISGYSFWTTLTSQIFSCVYWGVASWYLNRVVKADYGQSLPIYFPFMSSYWCPSSQHSHTTDEVDASARNFKDGGIPYEAVGETLLRQAENGESIEIHNLRKTFGEKIAVDGLNLSIYSGQITALLGHNGAGKTTTMAMLTGALAPTSGHAVVIGKDIRSQMGDIRQNIGICLQHDCLFPMLTVREHLQFFARLKGLYDTVSNEEAEQQIDQAITDVALYEKRNTFSKRLSGGMKRKLSVAMAFTGGSKVVLLDEPTSGMDPFSRRFTWNVIRQYRQDRCIILTTHFMDEADILGDRIAIMSEGQLRCAGSSLFLKRKYGVGYQLTMEKTQKKQATLEPNPVDVEAMGKSIGFVDDTIDEDLDSIVKEAVPEASLLNNTGSEIRYQLPLATAKNFPAMFDRLDTVAASGDIQSYGISMTTLDEVFLLVARGDHKDDDKSFLKSSRRLEQNDKGLAGGDDGRVLKSQKLEQDDRDVDTRSEHSNARSVMDLKQDFLFFRHVRALTRKRAANFRRDKKAWCCTTLAPSLCVLVGLMVVAFNAGNRKLEPITLSVQDLNENVQSVPKNPILFNAPESPFSCQPGDCFYNPPIVADEDVTYAYCGYVSRLQANSTEGNFNPFNTNSCSNSLSREIMSSMRSEVSVQEMVGVEEVIDSSLALFESSTQFEASQYGAILFTHEPNSVIGGTSTRFNDTSIATCQGASNVLNYNDPEQCATRFGGLGYVVQYNFTAIHAAPLLQSLVDEAIIRHATNSDTFQIKMTIDPLPMTAFESGLGEAEDSFLLWVLVVFSFPLVAGSFGAFIVVERESKAKHLQTVAGVNPSAYWISSILWDTVNYQIPLWITIALFFIFKLELLTTSSNDAFSGIVAVLFLYGPAASSFTYCLTFLFKSPSLCTMISVISGFLIGMAGPLAVFIMTLLSIENPEENNTSLRNKADIITWVLRFHPSFCLGKGIFNVLNIEVFKFIERDLNISAWSSPILGLEVLFLIIQTVGYLLLAIVLDIMLANPSIVSCGTKLCSPRGDSIENDTPDDDDVVQEAERVLSGGANSDLIVLSQFSKVYGNGKKAVDSLSLGIPHGQCFGLLGINGAGKTTTMQMLTAEFPPSGGDATLAGFSVTREPQKTRRRIGYCPQFDAHFPNMTGREHVELYASIKGVPLEFVKEAAALKLKEVGLSDFDSDRLCSEYSGGMKRRLSLAIATIGSPQIVFLDECSTGVDPVARREIWEMISAMVTDDTVEPSERTSVILTTHSMEECEALCPRIGIMANGKLRCLGSAQHLKNKFGKGYQVELKVDVVSADDDDYKENNAKILEANDINPELADNLFFTLVEAKEALNLLSDDKFLSSMLSSDNAIGYSVWRDAVSAEGVTLMELVAFATGELRIRNIERYMKSKFPENVMRERQDTKARYEVSSNGVKLSEIFSSIESNKDRLYLADYGVCQTSLEQVFNMHAAEAEKLKEGRNDH